MSARLFNFLADRILEYCEATPEIAGQRFAIFLERSEDIQSLQDSFRCKREAKPFVYQHPDGSEEYKTFQVGVGDSHLVVAIKTDDVTVDFFTTLRNCIADQSPEAFSGRSLLVVYGTKLDSLAKGCKDLTSTHGPLNLRVLLNDVRDRVTASGTLAKEWERRSLLAVLQRYEELIDTDSFTINDFAPVVECLEECSVEQAAMPKLGMFPDPQLENADNPEQRIEDNLDVFEKIERAMASDVPEASIKNLLNDKGQKEVIEADDWKQFDFSQIGSFQQKQTKDPILEYIPQNENRYCEGVVCWDRASATSKAGQRTRHIVIWNDEGRETLKIRLRFADRPKKVFAEFSQVVGGAVSACDTSGKSLVVTIQPEGNDPFFGRLTYQKRTQFNICCLPSEALGMASLKTLFSVIPKKKLWQIPIDAELQVGSPDQSTDAVDRAVEQHDVVNLDELETVNIRVSDDEVEEQVPITLIRNGVQLALELKREHDPVTPVSGLKLWQEKRTLESDCLLALGDETVKVQVGTDEYGLRHPVRELYPLEKRFLELGGVCWRKIGEQVEPAVQPDLPDAVSNAYTRILEEFSLRETIPSLAFFDEQLCELVDSLSAAIVEHFRALPTDSQVPDTAEGLLRIGMYEDGRLMMTPFAPLNLAYEAQVSRELRGESIGTELLRLLDQSAMLPYLKTANARGCVYASCAIEDAPQWLEFRRRTDRGAIVGSRVATTVSTKLDQFVRHFSFLFASRGGAPLVVHLFNMGDCSDVVRGIAAFYLDQLRKRSGKSDSAADYWVDDLIPIDVHIFGETDSVTEFDRLTHAGSVDELCNMFGESLESDNERVAIAEAMLKRVHFFYRREMGINDRDGDSQAHVTFMQASGFDVGSSAPSDFSHDEKQRSLSGVSLGGINSDVPSFMYKNLYRTGFGTKGLTTQYRNQFVELADALNTIAFFVKEPLSFSPDQAIYRVFDKDAQRMLADVFDASQWVCFVDPHFDLDFFRDRNDVVVLHYSDKYNNAAGYDAITATTKSEQYRELLRDALLSDTGLKDALEDTSRLNDVVQLFNAVNGEWLLDMVSSPTNQRKGTIGVISAIKLLLATMADDDEFTWVPVSIEEIVRVSGAIGLSSKDSPFSARNMGFVGTEFSDDVLMIGVGWRDSRIEMAFYPVEVKFGSFSTAVRDKAFKQGAKVSRYFANDKVRDDAFFGKVFRNFYAKLFLNSCDKLRTFGLWKGDLPTVLSDEVRVALLNDHFEIVDTSASDRGQFGIVAFDRECIAPSSATREETFEGEDVRYCVTSRQLEDCVMLCADPIATIKQSLETESAPTAVSLASDNQASPEPSRSPDSLAEATEGPSAAVDSATCVEPEVSPATKHSFRTLSAEDRHGIYLRIYEKLKALRVKLKPKKPDEIEFREGPTVFMIEVPLADAAKLKDLDRATDDLNLVLELPSEDSVRVVRDRGVAWLEVPKNEEKRVTVSTDILWNGFRSDIEEFSVPFAVDIAGETVSIDFASSTSPHLLVAGTTGSGKSVALETIIEGAAHFYDADHLQIFLIDPKGNELIDFEDLPHVQAPNGRTAEDAITRLEACVNEMESRYDLFREAKRVYGRSAKKLSEYNAMADVSLPRWLVILDEYSDLIESSREHKQQIESLLKRVSQKARAAGIHLIVATQKPLAEVVNSVVKSNLPAAIALQVKSNGDSRVILDEGGAELLSGRGDALYREGSRIRRVQIALHT